jgi:hypothetical protein
MTDRIVEQTQTGPVNPRRDDRAGILLFWAGSRELDRGDRNS